MGCTRSSFSVFIHFFGPCVPGKLPVLMRKTEIPESEDKIRVVGSTSLNPSHQGWGMGRSFGNTAGEGPWEGRSPGKGGRVGKREQRGPVVGGAQFPRLHWPSLSYLNQGKRVVGLNFGGEE